MALTQVNGGMLDSVAQQVGFKNRIINGAFTINQRGGSTVANTYGPDRWILSYSGGTPTWGVYSDGTINGNYAAPYITIAGSAGNTYVNFAQRIEAQNSKDLAGKSATVSYWAYQNTGSTMSVGTALSYATATDNFASVTAISSSNTSVPSGVWTQVTATFSVPSAATTGLQLSCFSNLPAVGAGQVVGLSYVQLEKGSTATSFDYRPYGTELVLCQRYYETCVGGGYMGFSSNGFFMGFGVNFSVTKRTVPSIARLSDLAAANVNTPYSENVTQFGFRSMAQATGGNANWTTYYGASAEL